MFEPRKKTKRLTIYCRIYDVQHQNELKKMAEESNSTTNEIALQMIQYCLNERAQAKK